VRAYATRIGLEVGGQYTSYVDWPDDRVVTTLVRTRRASVEPIPYWFPIVGTLPYKGYFDRIRAEAEAERLRSEEDYDVCVSGISAYSTLGWLDDPVTSPMLSRGAANFVETLFHELVHATAFVSDDVDFSESVAQFIGQQATIAFFSERRPELDFGPVGIDAASAWPDARHVRASIEDRRIIDRVTVAFRDRLVQLADAPDFAERRAAAEIQARAELAALPLQVIDPEVVAVMARLSNACLALRGTYVLDLPRHAEVLAALDGNLEALIQRLRQVANGELTIEAYYRAPSRAPSTRPQWPISSTTPSLTSARKTSRHASESTSASWAPSSSSPM
jgi:predicted aminopeptidase